MERYGQPLQLFLKEVEHMKGISWFGGFVCGMFGCIMAVVAFLCGMVTGMAINEKPKTKHYYSPKEVDDE